MKYKLSVFSNGYVAVLLGDNKGYVFEHVLVAENFLGRKLRRDEEVHHLNFNRADNRPSNLLVLPGTQHSKLHKWLQASSFRFLQPDYASLSKKEILGQCPRCKICRFPIERGKTCSMSHRRLYEEKLQSKKDEQKRELLEVLLSKRKSWIKIGKRLGLSDNGAKKLALRLGLR